MSRKDAKKKHEEEIVSEDSFDLDKKIKKLKAELHQCTKERKEYLDGWQRARADAINLKKIFESEKIAFADVLKEKMIIDMLSVIDSFELAFANEEMWSKIDENWRNGMENIYNQFISVMRKNDVEQFDDIYKEFDPERHISVEMVRVEKKKDDGKVVGVMQKGYRMGDKILRPAHVKIGEYSGN